MSTKREQIMQALKTKLDTVTGVQACYRSRVFALARGEVPALVIEPIADEADEDPIGFLNWSLLVRIAVIVRGGVPDQLADTFVEAVHAVVTSDLSLGGLAMDIQTQNVNFELLDGDQPIGVVSLGYRVKYRTSAGDLTN
jgi:hypothetical protein